MPDKIYRINIFIIGVLNVIHRIVYRVRNFCRNTCPNLEFIQR